MTHLRSSSSGGQARGIWYGFSAYALWGVFPIYFKMIGFVPADQIIAHRIIWSVPLAAGVLVFVLLRDTGDDASV